MTSPSDDLRHIQIVLVRTRSPGNVGAAARIVANAGFAGLTLVDPQGYDPERARWMAPGAADIVDEARIVSSVAEAVGHHHRVFGTSGRTRKQAWPVWTPPQLAAQMRADPRPTALLFGPEDYGLSNADMAFCEAILRLPTSAHRSLNLAQAVLATATWLMAAGPAPAPAPERRAGAPVVLRNHIVSDAMEILDQTPYFGGRQRGRTQAALFRMLSHQALDAREVASLRAMLKAIRMRVGLSPSAEP